MDPRKIFHNNEVHGFTYISRDAKLKRLGVRCINNHCWCMKRRTEREHLANGSTLLVAVGRYDTSRFENCTAGQWCAHIRAYCRLASGLPFVQGYLAFPPNRPRLELWWEVLFFISATFLAFLLAICPKSDLSELTELATQIKILPFHFRINSRRRVFLVTTSIGTLTNTIKYWNSTTFDRKSN